MSQVSVQSAAAHIRDHRSVLVGAGFTPAASPQEHSARLLRDDDGNLAFWSDSRHRLGTATNLRYGIFHFAPDIVWADLPILSDQQGLYLQADAGNARFNVSGGYDFLDYGLETAATSSFEKHSVYFNGSLQARRAVVLGLNSSFADLTYSGMFGDAQTITRLNLFTSIRRRIGGLRLDVFFDELASTVETNRREREGAAASLDWDMRERVRLTTEVRAERNLDWRGETRYSELSTLVRYDLFDSVTFGLQASIYRSAGESQAGTGGLGLNALLRFNDDLDRVTLLPGKRGHYKLAIKAELMRGADVTGGDTIIFTLEPDAASREPDLPEAMRRAFQNRPELGERWRKHSVAIRRQVVRYILDAKTAETQDKRSWIFIERLAETGKLSGN